MPALESGAQPLVIEPGNVILQHGHVFVQVRRGELTESFLRRLAPNFRSLRIAWRNQPVGVLAILEEGAPMPKPALLQQQREFVQSMSRDLALTQAFVVLGESLSASLLRSALRMMSIRRGDRRICGSVEEGASFLEPHVASPSAKELVTTVAYARRLLETTA
ncbi:MAG: hypothetical protein AAGE52_19805 [Myxococcota bacterium]